MHCPRSSFESIAVDLGDCIGVESCVDLKSDMDQEEEFCMVQKQRSSCGRRDDQRLEKMKKEYPPPIPWLARTENLPSHMPWIMKRYYTNDGRLIIKEEKVKRHEYFQACRSNGRLTLHLVPLDDDVLDDVLDDDHDEEGVGYDRDGFDAEIVDQTVVKNGRDVIGGGGGGEGGVGGDGGGAGRGKCYRFSTMIRNCCMFGGGMEVAAFRPVET